MWRKGVTAKGKPLPWRKPSFLPVSLHLAAPDGTITLMKKSAIVLTCILGLGVALSVGPAAAQGASGKTTNPSTANAQSSATPSPTGSAFTNQKDKASYALGMNIGNGLRQQSVDLDPSLISQGIKDALAGGKTLLTADEARAALMQFQNDMKAKQEEKMKQAAETNKNEGEAFLAANKTKEGVVALPSGLQYKVLTQGTGPKPALSDTVVCNYRGTLINGEEFDSSYKRGQPATFPVGGVIKGWTEALQLMPMGSKWQLFVPSGLAYGERGSGNQIGPNATLVFEVETISIKDKQ